MGGFGSGRRATRRPSVDTQVPRLDLRPLLRGAGTGDDSDLSGFTLLEVPRGAGWVEWWTDLEHREIVLLTEVNDELANARLKIDADALPTGGTRWRARCPVEGCASRTRADGLFYVPTIGWGCRHCTRTRYQSTLLRPGPRAAYRIRKLREQADGSSHGLLCEPRRAFGVTRAEHERQVHQIADAAEEWYRDQTRRIAQLLKWAVQLTRHELPDTDRKALEAEATSAARRALAGAAPHAAARPR